jgi:hypothetical protein
MEGAREVILWTLLIVLYIALFISLGMATLRKGHYVLFWVGIVFPVLWISARSCRRRLAPRVRPSAATSDAGSSHPDDEPTFP